MSISPFRSRTLSGIDAIHMALVSVSSCMCTEGLLLVSSVPSGSYNLPLPQGSLSPKGRGLVETSHLRLSVPRYLTLCTLLVVSFHMFPWYPNELPLEFSGTWAP